MSRGRETHAAVQPDENLLFRSRIGRGKKPEEEVVWVVGVLAEGQQPGVGLAHVEVDIGYTLSIDSKFWKHKVSISRIDEGGCGECSLVVFAFKNL